MNVTSINPVELHVPRAVLLAAAQQELAAFRALKPLQLDEEDQEEYDTEEERWLGFIQWIEAQPNAPIYVGLFPAELLPTFAAQPLSRGMVC